METTSGAYGKEYFRWQSVVGEFGGRANLFKFEKHINSTDKVLDYGCGGGYLLNALQCEVKVGIDINPTIISPPNVKILKTFDEVIALYGEKYFNVVISNHALEHIENPMNALKECYHLLKPQGTIIIVVPSESHLIKYQANDINNHIITFSPMNLGNLLTLNGFEVLSVRRLFHKWPPRYQSFAKIHWKFFHFMSYVYGFFKISSVQLIAVAKRPD